MQYYVPKLRAHLSYVCKRKLVKDTLSNACDQVFLVLTYVPRQFFRLCVSILRQQTYYTINCFVMSCDSDSDIQSNQ